MILGVEMDGKIVGRALAGKVKPALRELGFQRFQGRNAWRRNEFTVDLVSLSSMSAYIAFGAGCTSYSFGAEVGVYYPDLDDHGPVEWPKGYNLTFRGFPAKTIRQPFFHPYGQYAATVNDFGGEIAEWQRDRADVWYVLPDGGNLDKVVDDAVAVVLDQGMAFIDRHDDPILALESLRNPQGFNTSFGQMGIFAAGLGSPVNLRLIDGMTKIIEQRERA